MSVRRAIGFGASTRASASDVVALVQSVCGAIAPGTLLATVGRRLALARSVGAALDLDIVTFEADELEGTEGVKTPSSFVLATLGTSSIAEAAALRALGPSAKLVLRRMTGRFCTCAVAEAR